MTHPIAFPPPSTVPELALAKEVRAMFLGNEQGAWYDPSDMSTLFQDAAGTTPVTAVEQPVGLVLDKSKGMVLGPELVANGGFDSDTAWTKSAGATISGGAGVFAAVANNQGFSQTVALTPGARYQVTYTVTSFSSGGLKVYLNGATSAGIRTVPGTYREILVAGSVNALIGVFANGATTATIDNISIRELPGNHAFQTTAASRPVLSARVNLLNKTEQFDDVAWSSKIALTVELAADSSAPGVMYALRSLNDSLSVRNRYVGQTVSVVAARQYTATFCAKAGTRTGVRFATRNDDATRDAEFVLEGAGSVASTANAAASISLLAGGVYVCSVTWTSGADTSILYSINASESVIGDGSVMFYVSAPDLRVTNTGVNLPPYQRVNTATDYDTAGFPHYLRFDGVDDSLQTNSIDFTSTDKMTVFAGVRKLSDAAIAILVELSFSSTNNGGFGIQAPQALAPRYGFNSRGTANASLFVTGFQAPTTNVLTGIGDISGDQAILRVNGTQAGSSTTDQGTGTYGNYPLFIGRRGGTSLPFNGHLYQLIVRGAQSSLPQVQAGEKWTNNRTGAY
jgi:hypothetical protein